MIAIILLFIAGCTPEHNEPATLKSPIAPELVQDIGPEEVIINAAEGGGAEKVADRLCKSFSNIGLDVKLIATYQSSTFDSKRQYNTVVLPKISKYAIITEPKWNELGIPKYTDHYQVLEVINNTIVDHILYQLQKNK